MEQRMADGQLKKLATDIGRFPGNAVFIGPEVVAAMVLDLADARARIRELESKIESRAQEDAGRA